MKLQDFDLVALNDYLVYVNKQGKLIDSFGNYDASKLEKYQNAEVGSIGIFDEDTLRVRVEW